MTAGATVDSWSLWLHELETAVAELDHQLEDGALPELRAQAAPTGPVPDPLPALMMDRAQSLIRQIAQASARIEERRDAVAAELSKLAPPRPRTSPYAGWAEGTALDVIG